MPIIMKKRGFTTQASVAIQSRKRNVTTNKTNFTNQKK